MAARNPRPKPLRANVSKPSVPASNILLRLGAGCPVLGSSLVTLVDYKIKLLKSLKIKLSKNMHYF